MTCCFTPGGVLTRAEREAIARLREQRAAGKVPRAVAHPAVRENTDTLVSFYSNKTAGSGGGGGGGARERARKARKAAEKRVRRVRVSGRVAVKRVSARAGAKQGKAKGGSSAPVVREGSGAGTRAPVVDAIKAMTLWHALRKEQQQRDTASAKHDAEKDRDRHVARIKDATRKRFEEVRSRIAGGGWGDRFTARQKVEESDLNEANHDRYFQELMSAER